MEATADLISDDPRREVADSPLAEAREFIAFCKAGGGLTVSQLALTAGVKPPTIDKLVQRGKLSSVRFFNSKWIPRADCEAYLTKRAVKGDSGSAEGGRGIKTPSITEMFKATLEETSLG